MAALFCVDEINAHKALASLRGKPSARSPDFRRHIRWIAENFVAVAGSDSFLDAEESTIELILRNDKLLATEQEVFNSLLRWGRAQLRARKMQDTPENLRSVLNGLLNAVRFPTMTYEELSTNVKDSGVLRADELVEVFVYKGTIKAEAEEKAVTRFSTQPRTGNFYHMEKRREDWRRREGRSRSWQHIWHQLQSTGFVAVIPVCLFLFVLLASLYYDDSLDYGARWHWSVVYTPVILALALTLWNILSLWYFWGRERWDCCSRFQPETAVCCFPGIIQNEDGPCLSCCSDAIDYADNQGMAHLWLFALFLSTVGFVALIVVRQAMPASIPVMAIFGVIYAALGLACCMPCFCYTETSVGDRLGTYAAAAVCAWTPVFAFVVMLQLRITGEAEIDLWKVMMPFEIPLGLMSLAGVIGTVMIITKPCWDRHSSCDAEEYLAVLLGCCTLGPIVLFIIFISLWAAARDRGGNVSHWAPSLAEATAPLTALLALGALVSCAGAYIIYKDVRRRHNNSARGQLPQALLQHMTLPSPV